MGTSRLNESRKAGIFSIRGGLGQRENGLPVQKSKGHQIKKERKSCLVRSSSLSCIRQYMKNEKGMPLRGTEENRGGGGEIFTTKKKHLQFLDTRRKGRKRSKEGITSTDNS